MSRAGDGGGPVFRPIGQVAAELGVATHVLRFWQERFPEVAPVTRAGGRRYYRDRDVSLLRALRHLLHEERMTLEGVRRLIDREGAAAVARRWGGEVEPAEAPSAPVVAPLFPDWRDELRVIRGRLAAALAEARSAA
ncbi:MAG: MerR family transcriptional regulator [Sphingomonadaceae bacterium]